MRILITAFGSFAGRDMNATEGTAWQLAEILRGIGVDANSVVIPVTWQHAYDAVMNADLSSYDYVVSLGEGVSEFWVEAYANASAGGKDEEGLNKPDVAPDLQPARYDLDLRWSHLQEGDKQIAALFKQFNVDGWPVHFNRSVDTFICNYVRRLIRERVQKEGLSTKTGFIHVPPFFRAEQVLEGWQIHLVYALIVKRVMELNGWLPDSTNVIDEFDPREYFAAQSCGNLFRKQLPPPAHQYGALQMMLGPMRYFGDQRIFLATNGYAFAGAIIGSEANITRCAFPEDERRNGEWWPQFLEGALPVNVTSIRVLGHDDVTREDLRLAGYTAMPGDFWRKTLDPEREQNPLGELMFIG